MASPLLLLVLVSITASVTTAQDCKQCSASLITIRTTGSGAKPMTGDMIDTTGACATRKFTCVGLNANLEWWSNGASLGATLDGGSGTAKATLTCNAAGTAWTFQPDTTPITQVECAYA